MSEKKTPVFSDLSDEDRYFSLEIILEAVHKGFTTRLSMAAHRAFVHALNTGKEFDPKEVWSSLPKSTRNHFEHAAATIHDLEYELALLKSELVVDDDDDDRPLIGDSDEPL